MPLPIDATDTKINEELKNHFLFFETFDVSYQVYMLQGHIITSIVHNHNQELILIRISQGECQYKYRHPNNVGGVKQKDLYFTTLPCQTAFQTA